MLRIEKDYNGFTTRLRLSGRIQSDHLGEIQALMNCSSIRIVLDLSEVTLVDIGVVQFLKACVSEGIELVQCPPYVRQWMLCERTEGIVSDDH